MSASTDRTREFFHGYAGDFNAIYGNSNTPVNALVNRWFRRSMRLRFERTLAGIDAPGATILDVGCGPGHYSVELARRSAAKVIGVDFAEGMIDLARDQARAAGVEARCEFEVADVHALAYPEPFDYVIVMGFMDYVEAPRPLIEKIAAMTHKRAFFSFPTAHGLLAWQRKLRYRRRCPLYLYTRRRLEALCDDVPGMRATIDPIDRDYFVTLERR
ncbi:MAG: class I SAM-dependent methyltransferase [Nannocystaceae bacterium]